MDDDLCWIRLYGLYFLFLFIAKYALLEPWIAKLDCSSSRLMLAFFVCLECIILMGPVTDYLCLVKILGRMPTLAKVSTHIHTCKVSA